MNPGVEPNTQGSFGGAATSTNQPYTEKEMSALEALATMAITSPDKAARDEAAQQLLFLSSYDYWERVKEMLPYCNNNYLRFMVLKAMLFIVTNELGPHERFEMQMYILNYIQGRRVQQEVLPLYVRNELYSIYASAVYSNWKLSVISADTTKTSESEDLANAIILRLREYLQPDELLDCLLEIINYFARQGAKTVIFAMRHSFARHVLPQFFQAAVGFLNTDAVRALNVCCAALESLPPNPSHTISLRLTREPSICILAWPDWSEAIFAAAEVASSVVTANLEGEHAQLYARLLRHCSTLISPHDEFVPHRLLLAQRIGAVAESILRQISQAATWSCDSIEWLKLAFDLMDNIFERNKDAMANYFQYDGGYAALREWANASLIILRRFSDDEEELRQSLMHFFYLVGEELLPPRADSNDPLNLGTTEMNLRLPGRLDFDEVPFTGPSASSMAASPPPEAHFNAAFLVEVEQYLHNIFEAYFDTVVMKAHLREGSAELRSEWGLMLHNEKTLLPLAEMLFCDRVDFLAIITRRLKHTIAQYESLARRRSASAGGGGWNQGQSYGALLDLLQMQSTSDVEQLEAQLNGLVLNDQPPAPAPAPNDGALLFLVHVCLSRLSVMISIFAISITNGTAPNVEMEILQIIADFARELLTQDDGLTDTLLQCLSLLDEPTTMGEVSGGPTSAPPQVHVGILRALFFFGACVSSSNLSQSQSLCGICIDLIRYVYLYHSDIVVLVGDANMLLQQLLTNGASGTDFIGSTRFLALIDALLNDTLTVLRWTNTGERHTNEEMSVREDCFTVMTFFLETRRYAGYMVRGGIKTLVERILCDEYLDAHPVRAMKDLAAITKGCHQPDTLATILEVAMERKTGLMRIIAHNIHCAAPIVSWFAVLCHLGQRLLMEDPLSTTEWELASLMINALCHYFEYLSVPGEDGFHFATDAVEVSFMYDLADILRSICSASWCNVGIMLYYERAVVERFFIGSLQLVVSTSTPVLMSSESGYRRVFQAILSGLTIQGDAADVLYVALMRTGLWSSVMRLLTRCLNYCYSPDLVEAMRSILHRDQVRRRVAHYASIDATTLARAFHEVAVLISVAPQLDSRELYLCFSILQIAYDGAPEECSLQMERLLDYCSAYHRVRLRNIITMLKKGEANLFEQYVNVFGQCSKVGVLSAW